MATAPNHRPHLSAPQLIALSFLAAIAVGTLLLSLPIAHAAGARVGWLDALFTATSAVCVTGLIVVETGGAYSRFGQTVILLLFQLGGLGLLTFGTFLAYATGRRIGFSERLRLREQINAASVGGILRLLRAIVTLVVVAELVGAVLLYAPFVRDRGPAEGAYYALFHSVSAFNNAGFSLYPDSLSRFVGDPLVNVTVMLLIVLGGLGFVVIVNLLSRVRPRERAPLNLHTKMVLAISAVLIVVPTLALLAFEWGNPATLGDLSTGERLQAGLFQAITPRTAGFNTLDHAAMRTPSLLLTTVLMFVGGNPGSTAGGIKTLTLLVLLASVWSVARRRGDTAMFGRRLSQDTVVRAGAIAFGAALLVGSALLLLSLSEADTALLPLLFEAVSAFGTVGLSLGITAELSAAGKGIIVVLMYLGRIGFLTFAFALVAERPERALHYPTEEVVIG